MKVLPQNFRRLPAGRSGAVLNATGCAVAAGINHIPDLYAPPRLIHSSDRSLNRVRNLAQAAQGLTRWRNSVIVHPFNRFTESVCEACFGHRQSDMFP